MLVRYNSKLSVVATMSERWVKVNQQILNRMEKLASEDDKDRLKVVNSILFSLNALERSIKGWKSWAQNMNIISRFDLDELQEIDEALRQQTTTIIEYDMEATDRWKDKFPQGRGTVQRGRERDPREGGEGMYV
jgi:hypothetical protein